jgi:hypothetical protein
MEIAGAGNEAMLFFLRLKEEKTVGKNEKESS